MNNWTIIFFTGVAVGLLIAWLLGLRRESALRALAARKGFAYVGASLPRSFTLRGTGLQESTKVWNVIDGECGRKRVISFDCRVGTGKGSWRPTAIAVQAPRDVFGTAFSPDFILERSGDWSIMYEPRKLSLIPVGLMPISEIEGHLDAIR